ncbi:MULTISPECIES: hypothetical protein [Planktothricoides]|uniref:Uncharacterized protein n=1 Tax=Planktothricoides raciborskii GIHE-MW2 TaxID=2792601 RepID=A0AAU8JEP2_9CYAN|nr:hypothetical protein [Planktothricoides sp. SR001]KOR34616.1 hypothetical protein AM228_22980 [Planktothricoides sp. SR001]
MYQITEKCLDKISYQIVIEEVENALASYPECCKSNQNLRDFRQEVITDVTEKILSNRLLQKREKSSFQRLPYRSLELRLLIEDYAHAAIKFRLQGHQFNKLSD